jgi:DNA-binding PadR family transcriptional regulator
VARKVREAFTDALTPADGSRVPRRRRSDRDSLPLTTYATLGLLGLDNEFSAIDIEWRAHTYLRFFYWTPALSHIRRELDRLETLGHVEATEVQRGRLTRTLKYSITPQGIAALQDWAEQAPIDPPVKKNPTILRLWLGRRGADPEAVLKVLDEHIEFVKRERAELVAFVKHTERRFDAFKAGAPLDGLVAPGDPDGDSGTTEDDRQASMARVAWHNAIMRYCIRDFDSDLKNLRRLGEELRALVRQYESTMPPDATD